MAAFFPANTRLVMRFAQGNSFSFNKVRNGASDQGIVNLANAFSTLQVDPPTQIVRVVTRSLVM